MDWLPSSRARALHAEEVGSLGDVVHIKLENLLNDLWIVKMAEEAQRSRLRVPELKAFKEN